MSSLEVVLGLVLIILFYSLLATIIMELISGFLAMRGKHLERVLRTLLSPGDRKEEIFEAFRNSILYQQLAGRQMGKKSPPSYLESSTFRSILTKIIADRKEGQSFKNKIQQLPDNNLKELLMQFWDESGEQFQLFAEKVESWYNEVMDRATGWYKRNIQKVLLFLGILIAVIFNVDTLTIYDKLVKSSRVDMDNLVGLAESVSQQDIYILPEDSTSYLSGAPAVKPKQAIFQFIQEELEMLEDPLGIGWEEVTPTNDIFFWLLKTFGWLVTALCISKGAPFWFDLLRKIVDFRNTGNISQSTSPAAVAPPQNRPATYTPERDESEMIDKPVG